MLWLDVGGAVKTWLRPKHLWSSLPSARNRCFCNPAGPHRKWQRKLKQSLFCQSSLRLELVYASVFVSETLNCQRPQLFFTLLGRLPEDP